MNQIVAKFYSEAVLAEACGCYDLDFKVAKLIRANQNLVFDCGDKILRLTLSKIRPAEEIEPELAWLLDLQQRSIPVTEVVLSKGGHKLERIGGATYFSAVCFTKVVGRVPTAMDWNEAFFEQLGELTGRLHLAGRLFQKKTSHHYLSWDEIAEHHCEDGLVTKDYDFRPLYKRITTILRRRPQREDAYGLIHYDIHHGNYLLEEETNRIIAFDFEMCCRGRLIDDLATVLYYAGLHPQSKNIDDFEKVFYVALKKGYEKHLPVDPEEEAGIPHYLLYRDLLVLGFVNKAWGVDKLDDGQKAYVSRLLGAIARRRKTVD
ncbi:hypothetical protein CEQ90_13590 [Lewinellaceae bacterium SD302]|nr:hypothetical protein CEQ90_13590 [Lewinellaceae bacterium SD302]